MKAWQKHVFSPLDPFTVLPGIKNYNLPPSSIILIYRRARVLPWVLRGWLCSKEPQGLRQTSPGSLGRSGGDVCINPCGSGWSASQLELRSTCWGSPVNNPVKQHKTGAELESLCWKKCKWKYLPRNAGLPNPQMIWDYLPLQGLENIFCVKSYTCS